MDFTFIHAADLHLDSPLVGLGKKSQEYADAIQNASREAFDNLIDLAIRENCPFIVISGDIFDGEWKDYRSGLFFADRMRKLNDAKVQVFLILGNHDAENRLMKRLEFASNVRLLSSKKAESIEIDGLGVVLHGQSFPRREVLENIAQAYPKPVVGKFNIGLLHTACSGSDGHANYAPCSLEQLANHGYDYWALGHVHRHQILQEDPYIVFSGNLQGRHTRETGPKGAIRVRVSEGQITDISHIPLDTVRWYRIEIDISGLVDTTGLLALVEERLNSVYEECEERALAMRLTIIGETRLHHYLVVQYDEVCEEIETVISNIGGDIWLESIEIETQPPVSRVAPDATIAQQIIDLIENLDNDPQIAEFLERKLSEVKAKLPAAAKSDELFEEINANTRKAAVRQAKARLENREEVNL